MAISTRWFVLARRYGLWGALRRAPATARNQGIRHLWPRSSGFWEFMILAVLVPGLGFAAEVFLPMLPILLVPGSLISPKLGNLLEKTALIDGILGALLASYIWLRGLEYVARPSIPRKGGLPRLWFPPGLSRKARDHLSLNVYWYLRIKTATVFAAVYPWVPLAVLLGNVSGNSPGASSSSSQNTGPPFLVLGVLILVMLPSMVPSLADAPLVENRLVSAKACLEISEVLQPNEPSSTRESPYPGLIADPLGRQRPALAQIARHLADTARQLDAQQPRGLPPHPISTLLRAASLSVRQFLGNQRSLHEPIPDDLAELLETTLGLFAAHHDQAAYQRLADQAAAFDQHGNPAVELIGNPPSRLVAFASRTMTGIPKLALAITSIAAITAIIIAVALALLHRMNITDLLGYLR